MEELTSGGACERQGDNTLWLLKGMQQIDEAIGERIGLTRTGGSGDRNILK